MKEKIPYPSLIAAILAVAMVVLCVSCGPKRVEDREPIRSWLAERDRLLEEAEGLSVQELVDRLAEVGNFQRTAALIELRVREPEDVIHLLIDQHSFTDTVPVLTSRDIPRNDYLAYIRSCGVEALPVLTEILEAPTPENQDEYYIHKTCWALDGLAMIGPDAAETVPLLLGKLVEDEHSGFTSSICHALSAIEYKSPEVTDVLLGIIESEELASNGVSACYALGDLAEPGDERVIAALIHYIDRVEKRFGYQDSEYELAARSALCELGWEYDENFRIIRDSLSSENHMGSAYKFVALGHIGNADAIEFLNNYMFEGSASEGMILDVLSFVVGLEPDAKQILERALYLPPMDYDVRPRAVYYLGNYGAESRDMLPTMIDFYEYYQKTGSDEEFESNMVLMKDAILRVYEGL